MDNNEREVARTENFEAGDTQCIRCGKTFHLYFNGGELDSNECCGLVYRTVAQRTDLVVYEKMPRQEIKMNETTNKPAVALVPLLNLGYEPAIDLTWRLLLERPAEANISHSTMPTMDRHREFVLNAPYAAWYAILSEDKVPVGTALLTRKNEIGIAILKEYQRNGYAEAAIRQLIKANTPAEGVPSQSAGHFLANVAPTNEASISLFNKLGGRVIQWTYRL